MGMPLLKIVSGENPREIAARVLGGRESGQYVEQLLDKELGASRLSEPDRRLCQELVYGVVRWQGTLDWLIARKTAGRQQKLGLQNLLRLGLYQIFWLERVPDHAAVHQTVELARRSGFGPQSGFVNAVLRGYLREEEVTRQALAQLKVVEPWIGYSHPQWLAQRWQDRWGNERAAALMAWNNTPPKTYARVNLLKADPGKLLEQWRGENVDYDFMRRDWFEENLVFELKAHPPLHRLASFRDGFFYIQDPSTLLAVHELDPRAGETVLDLCAAPGGKLTFMAQVLRNEGKIIAHDTASERIALIHENCSRLGVSCVQTICSNDAPGNLEPQLHAAAPNGIDKILVDAPCSNTGVMRRRVDLRWRIRPEELQRLSQTQWALLKTAAGLLKSGGLLVYSTCSLEPEENESVIKEFLQAMPGFSLIHQRELSPFADAVDGAYVARLQKTV